MTSTTATASPKNLKGVPTEDPLKTAPLVDLDNWPESSNTSQTRKEQSARDVSVSEFLSVFKCRSPIFPNDSNVVVRVPDTATLGDALKKMTELKVLAIPVVDHHTGKPLYIVTMKDLVAYFVGHFEDRDFQTDFWSVLTNFFYVPDYCDEIAKKPLSQLVGVIGSFGLEPMVVINDEKTVLEAAKEMLQKNAHRVLIVDDSGYLSNMITQSRILQFVPSVLENSSKAQITLRELGLGFKKIYAVHEDQLAYKAFRTMINRNLSCLAVVDSDNRLVGNLSVTDFKLAGYHSQYWNYLGYPVKEYLSQLSKKSKVHIRHRIFYNSDDPRQVIVAVKPDDTLMTAVKYLTFFRVHRIYIVDDAHRPLGMISITDILKELLDFNQA
jgi:CBS domain-containing protein